MHDAPAQEHTSCWKHGGWCTCKHVPPVGDRPRRCPAHWELSLLCSLSSAVECCRGKTVALHMATVPPLHLCSTPACNTRPPASSCCPTAGPLTIHEAGGQVLAHNAIRGCKEGEHIFDEVLLITCRWWTGGWVGRWTRVGSRRGSRYAGCRSQPCAPPVSTSRFWSHPVEASPIHLHATATALMSPVHRVTPVSPGDAYSLLRVSQSRMSCPRSTSSTVQKLAMAFL